MFIRNFHFEPYIQVCGRLLMQSWLTHSNHADPPHPYRLIVLTVSLRSTPLGLLSKTTLSTEQAFYDGSLHDSAAGKDSPLEL